MTSSVEGILEEEIPFYEIFKALYPSGSVTGTPKIRAMQIIRELETEERRIYTGAIGYVTPERDLFFNIPIRTILLQGDQAEMGVGGGITYYSTPEGEFEECLIKSRFIKAAL
jgi:para-aminobenzoate synthetase/4-amino-4-deoxychorismate lyase